MNAVHKVQKALAILSAVAAAFAFAMCLAFCLLGEVNSAMLSAVAGAGLSLMAILRQEDAFASH